MFITLPKYLLALSNDNSGSFPIRGPMKLDLDKIICFETEKANVPSVDENGLRIIKYTGQVMEERAFTKIRLPDNFIFFLPEEIGNKVSLLADLHLVDLRYIQMKSDVAFTTESTDNGTYIAQVGDLFYIMHRKDGSYFLFHKLKDDEAKPISLHQSDFYALLHKSTVLDLFDVDIAKIKRNLDRYSIALGRIYESANP